MITMAREDTGCLVLVLDIDLFGARARHWLPGSDRRREQYQAILRRLTDEFDDNVRFVEHSAALSGQQLEEMKPDGIHRNAAGHRLTAQALCAEVLRWLEVS
jgi:lysophospholipase L1-like esterase